MRVIGHEKRFFSVVHVLEKSESLFAAAETVDIAKLIWYWYCRKYLGEYDDLLQADD